MISTLWGAARMKLSVAVSPLPRRARRAARRRRPRRCTVGGCCQAEHSSSTSLATTFYSGRLSHAMRPLALLAVLAPAAALEVLRAEGSPHDTACGGAGAACSSWNTDTARLSRAARIASESASVPLARRSPNPMHARARAAGVGQLVVHRQDGQHGSQTVRSSFSSSRRPWRARAPRLPSRARASPGQTPASYERWW